MSAEVVPTCWECGRRWRASPDRDAYECKCGLALSGQEAERIASGAVTPELAEVEHGPPWKDPDPGLRVSDKFSDIVAGTWDYVEVDMATLPDPAAWRRLCADAFEGSGQQYVGPALRTDDFCKRPTGSGRTLVTDTGEELLRHSVYALVPVGLEAAGVAAVVRFVSDKHGPGRLWAHGDVPIGPLRKRVQAGYRGAELSGVMHVVLGCYYFHQSDVAVNVR